MKWDWVISSHLTCPMSEISVSSYSILIILVALRQTCFLCSPYTGNTVATVGTVGTVGTHRPTPKGTESTILSIHHYQRTRPTTPNWEKGGSLNHSCWAGQTKKTLRRFYQKRKTSPEEVVQQTPQACKSRRALLGVSNMR